MKLNEIVQAMKFDARLVDRNLKNQVINEQELKAYLDSLPDLSDKKEQLNLDENDSVSNTSANTTSSGGDTNSDLM